MATIQTVVPGYLASVSPVWRRSGVFTRSLSSFDGSRRDPAHAAGFRAVAVHLANTPQAWANLAELNLLRGEFRALGWAVVGWGDFGHGTDPLSDGQQAGDAAGDLSLDGWIAAGEAWVEGAANYWKSAAFMTGWRATGTRAPLMLACLSSVTANFGRGVEYTPFTRWPGLAVGPECYCASNPLYTLPAMRGSFRKAGVPLERVVPICNVVKGKPLPTRYARWRGPRWLYTGEDTEPAQFARVLVGGPS